MKSYSKSTLKANVCIIVCSLVNIPTPLKNLSIIIASISYLVPLIKGNIL